MSIVISLYDYTGVAATPRGFAEAIYQANGKIL